MYTAMAMSRNTEVTLRWSRSQMFMVINSAMFTLLFARDPSFWLFLGLGIFGMVIGLVWILINRKTQQWVDYWQERLGEIKHEEEPTTVNVFVGPKWNEINKGFTFHKLLSVLPYLFMSLWIGIFFVSFFKF